MIILFTDYGIQGPYAGQLKGAIACHAPDIRVVDLLHDSPQYNPHAGAHLLAAMVPQFPPGSVFLAVVDPGVGTPRKAVVMVVDGKWFVGPDNGLLSIVAARAQATVMWRIVWRPDNLSDTFHGRDLFAPVAAWIAAGRFPEDKLEVIDGLQVAFDANDLPRILYIDSFGNAWTGLRGAAIPETALLKTKEHTLGHRRVFAESGKGEPFWYVNSVGLVELAVNRGNLAELMGLKIGDMVNLSGSPGSHLH
jgi:S-adenosyl-L-methionine hydrolase (adenosine-forming)